MQKEYFLNLTRDKKEVLSSFDYYCLVAPNEWRVVNSIPLRRMLLESPEETRSLVKSLRLGTGIIGELDCSSGDADYAPRNRNEVVIGIGELGIQALIGLGALPCISCHSGERLAGLFPIGLKINDIGFLVNNYDARRLNWPQLLQLGVAPNRIYTRPNLGDDEVMDVVDMFERADLPVPAIGYYDRSRTDKFNRYK